MNKSFFYSTVVAIALGTAVLPSIASAQDFVSAPQPAVTISDLQNAINAENPDTALIQSIIASLIAQDPNNMAQIQAVVANASPEVQAAANAALGATGSIATGARGGPAATTNNSAAAIAGGGGSGNNGNNDTDNANGNNGNANGVTGNGNGNGNNGNGNGNGGAVTPSAN